MINFRYHVVSLVAVFLALGVGIIMGSTVISQTLVSQLRGQTRTLKDINAGLRASNDTQARQIEFWNRFGSTIVPSLVKDKLPGRPIVLVVQDGTGASMVDAIAKTLQDAGCPKPARIVLTDRWALEDREAQESLARAVGASGTTVTIPSPSPAPDALLGAAAGTLARRMQSPGDPRDAGDALKTLADAGFLHLADTTAGAFPPPGAFIVVVASGKEGDRALQEGFFVPLVRALSSKPVVAVIEPLGSKESLVDEILSDATLASAVSTVDDGDNAAGTLSLVWVIREAAAGRDALHYGVRRGTAGVSPAA